jgi:antirestriction protein ArdC
MENASQKTKTKHASLQTSTKSQDDIYTRVTNKILSDLEKGNLTWRQPWNSQNLSGQVTFPLRWNTIPYTGINTIMLWATAAEKSFELPHWMTFNQAVELKGSVVKGEKGAQIVYADKILKQEENSDGETETKQIPFLKTYTVFNASQITGLPEHFYQAPTPNQMESIQRIGALDSFFAQTKADIYTGFKASYAQDSDRIQMPPFESFETVEDYYSVLSHELTHNAAWLIMPHRTGLMMF